MEQVLLIQPSEFWNKQSEILRQIFKEEFSKIPTTSNQEDLIVIDDACKLLHKSKQSIYNYMDEGRLQGYNLGGEKVKNAKDLSKKEKESLYFFRSEIIGSMVKRSRK
jgi:myo-inositol-hexaphosphate 3-phosphohydrolase